MVVWTALLTAVAYVEGHTGCRLKADNLPTNGGIRQRLLLFTVRLPFRPARVGPARQLATATCMIRFCGDSGKSQARLQRPVTVHVQQLESTLEAESAQTPISTS